MEVLLSVLHLAHVELSDSADSIALMDDGRRLPVRLREDDVNEVICAWDDLNLLEVVLWHRSLP